LASRFPTLAAGPALDPAVERLEQPIGEQGPHVAVLPMQADARRELFRDAKLGRPGCDFGLGPVDLSLGDLRRFSPNFVVVERVASAKLVFRSRR
jgi:hypothetical protein